MRFQVVDGDEGKSARNGQGLGRHHPDHDTADQPGPAGRRNTVQRAQLNIGLVQCLANDAVEIIEMGARGDLRHDAAIGPVFVELAEHDVRQNGAVVGDNRGGGLVAAGFDTQDNHGRHIALPASCRQR